MKKKTKKQDDVMIEALLNKLASQNKTGIHLPWREAEYKKNMRYMDQLLEKKLVSERGHKEYSEELLSRTLDDETYDMFYECLLREYGKTK